MGSMKYMRLLLSLILPCSKSTSMTSFITITSGRVRTKKKVRTKRKVFQRLEELY